MFLSYLILISNKEAINLNTDITDNQDSNIQNNLLNLNGTQESNDMFVFNDITNEQNSLYFNDDLNENIKPYEVIWDFTKSLIVIFFILLEFIFIVMFCLTFDLNYLYYMFVLFIIRNFIFKIMHN